MVCFKAATGGKLFKKEELQNYEQIFFFTLVSSASTRLGLLKTITAGSAARLWSASRLPLKQQMLAQLYLLTHTCNH